MIATRTPLRISLTGGGTDLPAFSNKTPGAVVSFAIDKYVYVIVNEKFDSKVRVSYSKTENVGHVMEIKHDIIRESLLAHNITNGIEVVTVADIPGTGTGLGSSSALAVGLSRALSRYTGVDANQHPCIYARSAYVVERDRCEHPVGKQDHWASAHGGMHYYRFETDGKVVSELINLHPHERQELENRFVLLWTGRVRQANTILQRQEAGMDSHGSFELGKRMRNQTEDLRKDLYAKNLNEIDFGHYLDSNWQAKRQMAIGITDEWIDGKYKKALELGATGGKLCGAGGGGFFLFYGPLRVGSRLENALGMQRMPFKIDTQGVQLVYEPFE